MDEHYVSHHHRLTKDNIYHSSNIAGDKNPHKGRRICFVATIRGSTLEIPSGLVPGSF